MKYLYLLILMGCTLVVSGQDLPADADSSSQESAQFDLYPNPAINDEVYVTTGNNFGKDITVYDIFGKVVLRDRIKSNVLNISKLVPGVYFLQVEERNKTMTRKLVVK